jgi:hypothetical protein
MVVVLGLIRGVVEHDQRQDHLLERDLVHGDAIFREMRRRIDMGAVLPNHVVGGRAETVVLDRVRLPGFRVEGWREIGLSESRPHRCRRAEAVSKVDELLAGNDAIGSIEIATRSSRRARQQSKRQSDNRISEKHASLLEWSILRCTRCTRVRAGMTNKDLRQ